jgi:quinoprotein glucose dehydrogenase
MVGNVDRLLSLAIVCSLGTAQHATRADEDWPSYGAEAANRKYSPADQIGQDSVQRLRIAWRWRSPDEEKKLEANVRPWLFEVTPIKVDGKLYVSTGMGLMAAIDASTGNTLWTYDPKSYTRGQAALYGFTHRGVAYWAGAAEAPSRILMGTVDGYLMALDAATGKPSAGFGHDGRVDLLAEWPQANRDLYSVTSPPVIVRDVAVVGSGISDALGPGSSTPPGDVRGYDVRTGRLLWTFHSVPREGEFGNDTWFQGSSKTPRGVSAWAPLSADEDLGFVYLPFSTPSSDYYGGDRPGNNLFGASIVCLNAATGKRVWHFQTTHHDIWDYDPPAAPILTNIVVNGLPVKALAQVTKQGFMFVLNRETGKPVWPIVERPVPQSAAGKEATAATQPFPTKPAPFERQGITEADLINFTPTLRAEALKILRQYDFGPLYTPPSFRGAISVPGSQGGASWAGAAFDPETHTLYVPSVTRPTVMTLYEPDNPRFPVENRTTDRFFGFRASITGPQGLPLLKPPYGRITAINLNTGDHRWVVASGEGPRDHPALKRLSLPKLGWPLRTFVLVTKTLLFAAQEGPVGPERIVRRSLQADHSIRDSKLRVYDKSSGKNLAEFDLPANATGSPMTYISGGKQFIVLAVGGSNLPAELVAFSLN